jgi:hypothetical protein
MSKPYERERDEKQAAQEFIDALKADVVIPVSSPGKL